MTQVKILATQVLRSRETGSTYIAFLDTTGSLEGASGDPDGTCAVRCHAAIKTGFPNPEPEDGVLLDIPIGALKLAQ